MTFNDFEEIKAAIKAVERLPKWVADAREYHTKLKALVYGDEFKDLLLRIEHIETEAKAKARQRYSRPIKDINSKILEPFSNIYSATGFNLTLTVSDSQKETLLKELSDVRGGYSLQKWLDTYWSKDMYIVDPNGLIFLEWKDENTWPTYKSIDCIRYYKADGLQCEYVIFEPTHQKDSNIKLWRVVDDSTDYLISQNGDTFDIVEAKTYTNPFGICPARVNSDIIQLGKDYRLSPLDQIIETEEEFLRDRSVLTIYKFKNGFATPYRPKIICPSCHGTKKSGDSACPDCDGKGFLFDKDVTDEYIVPISLDADNQPQMPSDFAGFISPDLEIWNQYRSEAKLLFNEMFETIWGTRESEAKDQTAMSVILNTQPMTNKLDSLSDVAEMQENALMNMIGIFVLNLEHDDIVGFKSYGRNYIIQPPEYLLEQYQKSNESKDPLSVRDRKLTEYITSKFKTDLESLRVELLKKDLEPYVHYDVELVKDIYGNIEAAKKGLFVDWWETLTQADLLRTKDQLESNMNAWLEARLKKLAIVPSNQNNE